MKKRIYFENKRPEMDYFITTTPRSAIEFGCGNGGFSELLKQKYKCEAWGVDIDPESVKNAEKIIDKAICGDAYEIIEILPLNHFDYVICNDFIEHIYSPEKFFVNLRKCLTDDAVLVCSLPNIRYFNHFKRYFFMKDWKYRDQGILDNTHLRFFTKKSMKRSINEWGFQIELIKGLMPTKTAFFYFFNILSLNFIGDMRFVQYGFRARLKNYNDNK